MRAIYPDERTRENFYEFVCKAGEDICRLCDVAESPEVVESCFVCWQKLSYFPFPSKLSFVTQCHVMRMCCCISGAVFTESSKFAKMNHVRNSERFRDNLIVQRAFGDICLAYQLHIRNELQNEKDQFHREIQQQRENFEHERGQYEQRVKGVLQEREQREVELVAKIEEEKRNKDAEIDALKVDFDAEREELKEKLRNAEQCK